MKKTVAVLGIVVAVVIVGVLSYVLLSGENDREEAEEVTVDGQVYTWEDMMERFDTRTIAGNTGVTLSDIVNDTALANPGTRQYRIVASDGYYKNVTWGNMMEGIIVQTEEEGELVFMTIFPSLPNRYKVKSVTDIEVVDTDTLLVGEREYTWEQPFDRMFDEVSIGGYDGIRLSDLLNHTGLADRVTYEYWLLAEDGYNKTVNWTNMLAGVLVRNGHMTAFAELPNSHNIHDLIEIRVL